MSLLQRSFGSPSPSTAAAAEAHTLRATAVDTRELAVAAREAAAAARERALVARALESGARMFETGDPVMHAAAFAFIQIAADGGDSEAKVRLGEMLCDRSSSCGEKL
jgi:hypothetical protein